LTTERQNARQVSVVVPTFARPDALADCVRSLCEGSVLPGEIIVVGREGDEPTRGMMERLALDLEKTVSIRSCWVNVRGHVPPVESGLRAASNEVVAFVDDDVTVSQGWLEALLGPFSDPAVGVVGGRVVVPGQSSGRPKGKPGHVTWYGKTWGNAASVDGAIVMDVDTVMECNWAWRRELLSALEMDPELNFDDASMYGLDLCLGAKAAGFRIVHEPRALVLHHVKPRTPELDRANRPARTFSYCRNYTYVMLKRLPTWRKYVFLIWWFAIGEGLAEGVGALAANEFSGRRLPPGVTRSAFAGKMEGVRVWLRARRNGPAHRTEIRQPG
jgi:GT2 family glycosyltransferase